MVFEDMPEEISKLKLTPLHTLLVQHSCESWDEYWEDCKAPFPNFPSFVKGIMSSLESQHAKRLILFHEDRRYFLAGLLAATQLKLPIVFPPNNTPGTLEDIRQHGDVFFKDLDLNTSVRSSHPLPTPPNPEDVTLCFYTSGSTGHPKAIIKNLLQLENEVGTLDQTWPLQGMVYSTVSHQHIYGLLFSLLWPLSRGIPLFVKTIHFWEDLLPHLNIDDTLISSPAHLGRFPVDTTPICTPGLIFSSGGPLSTQAITATRKLFNAFPWEVYGSTETGGIAYRQREEDNQPWTPFSTLQIATGDDGRLRIKSPHLPNDEFFETDDRIEQLHARSSQFHLRGRVDLTVKIEGKRIHLGELETRLKSHHLINDAAVFVLKGSSREYLAAVIVLTPDGVLELKAREQYRFIQQLQRFLKNHIEGVLIPKRWRCVEHIPTNTQGKRSFAELETLFEKRLGPLRDPQIISSEKTPGELKIRFIVPETLSYLEGHFQDNPIVPGVVQLHWVFQFAKEHFQITGYAREGQRIKFNRLMQPKADVALEVSHDPNKLLIHYKYTDISGEPFSSGKIYYTPGGARGE